MPDRASRGPVARERFRDADRYRVHREWSRYEGTSQRELWLALREGFLREWSASLPAPLPSLLEVGPGPGRFSPILATATGRLLLVDISRAMLRSATNVRAERILAEGQRLPVRPGSVGAVVALGNVLGFSGDEGRLLLREMAEALMPGGWLVLESYSPALARPLCLQGLDSGTFPWGGPPTREALREGLARGWVAVEGAPAPSREFRSYSAQQVTTLLGTHGMEVAQVRTMAPLTGGDARWVESALRSPRMTPTRLQAWERLAGDEPAVQAQGGHFLLTARRAVQPRRPQRALP